MKARRNFWLAAGLAGIAIAAGGAVRPAAGNGFAVVELFTSEGCSSCPPADALVAAVQKEAKDQPVYILAFHVDYWDRLGWKDAFSDAAYSDRQKDYARWLRLKSIYTPQVVVNGTKEFVGSDAGTLQQAIHASLQETSRVRLSLENVSLGGGKLSWQAHADGDGGDLRLLVAVIERNAVTKVGGGENGGKTLSHVQIVRSFTTVQPNGKGDASGHLAWPAGMKAPDGEVIAFLQETGSGKIVAATRSEVK